MKECKFCGMPLENDEEDVCAVCKNDDFREKITPIEDEEI